MLSAHFDSWDGASGATDNGTGTITMLEAMRILKQRLSQSEAHDPGRPLERRGAGAQRLARLRRGSSRGRERPPGALQPGQRHRPDREHRASGLIDAGGALRQLDVADSDRDQPPHHAQFPGQPGRRRTRQRVLHLLRRAGVRARLAAWEYGTYTWHTNRDTFDKIVFDELKNNATLTAMLVYLASEDPETMPRERRVMPVDPATGKVRPWPECTKPARASTESQR